MKRNLSQSRRPVLKSFGLMVLVCSLMGSPGISGVAFAANSSPSPSPSPSVSTESMQPSSTSASPTSSVTTPLASIPATPTPSPSTSQTMAEAIGKGAEMGQRSARVTASSSTTAVKQLSAESLGSEGTWMPTFGVKGLDVSGYQTNVDWQQQWNMGSRFAYVKASEGNYFTNDLFSSQYQGARSVGMIRGAYHFAIPNWSSGADQARYFVQNGGGWSPDGYTMPPVLDFEFNPYEGRTINGFYFGNTCYNMSAGQLASWVQDFGNTVRALTGRLPVIYTNTSWWNQCLGNPSGFGDYPLWVAAYPSSATDYPGALPSASWSAYSIWQFSSTGPFAGDSNVWNGDYPSLQRFAGAALPTGSFDDLSVTGSGTQFALRARGWSVDLANAAVSNQTHVYVTGPDGSTTGYPWVANTSRPDVDQALGYGPSHGFDGSIPISRSGTYSACAYSIGTYGNTPLGCKSVTATGIGVPTGSFDSLTQIRAVDKVTLQLKGWAVDQANPGNSTYADTYVTAPDGTTTGYRMTANTPRPDVDAATGLGSNHGFDYQIPVSTPGAYKACTYAIGTNANIPLGCQTLNVGANPSPIGSYDALSLTLAPNSATLQVRGWTLDPTQPGTSNPVSVYIASKDGVAITNPTPTSLTANLQRPDVNSALGTIGDHGFQATLPISSTGNYSVCTRATGVAPVSNGPTLLGCKSISVTTTPATTGFLDSAAVQISSGQAAVVTQGWTLDPALPAISIPVHVYITFPDGSTKGYPFTANLKRADVNSALQTTGDHGYSTSVPISTRGQYRVCSYGVAVSIFSAYNAQLGCRTLTY
ncbi:GH25 family lysozyme M1 (1,4-beta-N-acetylmuramidase) [Arthrobacter sp. AG258]|nr:GH25 family lysozyme M1 (1,4-beta-N-acetylmuramidase) [Arthrobacter sp. AG258]